MKQRPVPPGGLESARRAAMDEMMVAIDTVHDWKVKLNIEHTWTEMTWSTKMLPDTFDIRFSLRTSIVYNSSLYRGSLRFSKAILLA